MIINLISESQYFPTLWGGTHTAFLTNVSMLRARKVEVRINSWRRADIVHVHTFGLFSLFKLITNRSTVVTTHMLPETLVGTFKGEKYWFGYFKKYMKFFYNNADLVVALTPQAKDYLEKLGVRSKIVIIPNPVDTYKFRQDMSLKEIGRKVLKLDKASFIVLAVGHFIKRKGVDDFILLAKQMPSLIFVWAGGRTTSSFGSEGKVEKSLDKNMPNNLIITGNTTYDKMPAFYNSADVFLLPSYQEVAPMTVIEAAACGVPVILRDLPQYKTLYENSYLFGKNVDEFENAINSLKNDNILYTEMSAKSKLLSEKFSFERIANVLIEQYQALISSR